MKKKISQIMGLFLLAFAILDLIVLYITRYTITGILFLGMILAALAIALVTNKIFFKQNKKRLFKVGETVKVINVDPLPGNTIAPALELGKEYLILLAIKDSQGNQHLDLGIKSTLNYVRSYETKEHLPNGNIIHWVHPSRVK